MTESESLLSILSESYFFKETVFDNLLFTPEGETEKELADLVINLQDVIIAIQLKERNEKDQTFDADKEQTWLQKRCRQAKDQAKKTMQLIASGKLPVFQNKQGQSIVFETDAEVMPLVVFKNDYIDSYPHILRKHSESGMDINCMSYEDYKKMCQMLISPMEIFMYLKYRRDFYTRHGEVDLAIYDGEDGNITLTKPRQREVLVMQFLNEVYGITEAEKHIEALHYFRLFLHQLPKQTIGSSTKDGSFNLITFFAHLGRCEISAFLECLKDTRERAQNGETGMLHSMRRDSGELAIVFIAGDKMLPFEYIRDLIVAKSGNRIKRILEIMISWIDEEQFYMNFGYWDDSRRKSGQSTRTV